MLLVAAGLFLRSFARLQDVNPGFDARGVMTAIFSLPKEQYPDGVRQASFYRKVLERLTNAAGVSSAAIGFVGPFCQCGNSGGFVRADRKLAPGDPGPHSDMRMVTPRYFNTLAITLKRGRAFTELDLPQTEPVVVIDETLARQYWPSEDPVGKQIQLSSQNPTRYTVVGVVGHVLASDLAADSGTGVVYFSLFQQKDPISVAWIVARTPGDPASLVGPIREAVRAADLEQPVHTFKSLDELVSDSLAPRRFVMRLLGFFAATALFMAALGLYGVISYSVTLRGREIGIRSALGEHPRSVLAGVLSHSVRLAGIGVAVGIVGSILIDHILESQLFEVNAFDPAILTAVAATLLITALLAGYLPARRAVRIDPLNALRAE
jgi:predicted permease